MEFGKAPFPAKGGAPLTLSMGRTWAEPQRHKLGGRAPLVRRLARKTQEWTHQPVPRTGLLCCGGCLGAMGTGRLHCRPRGLGGLPLRGRVHGDQPCWPPSWAFRLNLVWAQSRWDPSSQGGPAFSRTQSVSHALYPGPLRALLRTRASSASAGNLRPRGAPPCPPFRPLPPPAGWVHVPSLTHARVSCAHTARALSPPPPGKPHLRGRSGPGGILCGACPHWGPPEAPLGPPPRGQWLSTQACCTPSCTPLAALHPCAGTPSPAQPPRMLGAILQTPKATALLMWLQPLGPSKLGWWTRSLSSPL